MKIKNVVIVGCVGYFIALGISSIAQAHDAVQSHSQLEQPLPRVKDPAPALPMGTLAKDHEEARLTQEYEKISAEVAQIQKQIAQLAEIFGSLNFSPTAPKKSAGTVVAPSSKKSGESKKDVAQAFQTLLTAPYARFVTADDPTGKQAWRAALKKKYNKLRALYHQPQGKMDMAWIKERLQELGIRRTV